MGVGAGTELAGFRIAEPIAEGARAVVFLAERMSSGERAAFKVLREELAEDDGFRRRFLRESRHAASLDHPHVVDVHDAGEAGGVLYIAMEYVEGTDLCELLGDGPLSPAQALPMLDQVAAALDAAHAIGLLHRSRRRSQRIRRTATSPARRSWSTRRLSRMSSCPRLRGGRDIA